MEDLRMLNGLQFRSKRIPPDRWERHRDELTRLYENWKLTEVREFMEKHHDFVATERQFNHQFQKWGLSKYRKRWKRVRPASKIPRSSSRPRRMIPDDLDSNSAVTDVYTESEIEGSLTDTDIGQDVLLDMKTEMVDGLAPFDQNRSFDVGQVPAHRCLRECLEWCLSQLLDDNNDAFAEVSKAPCGSAEQCLACCLCRRYTDQSQKCRNQESDSDRSWMVRAKNDAGIAPSKMLCTLVAMVVRFRQDGPLLSDPSGSMLALFAGVSSWSNNRLWHEFEAELGRDPRYCAPTELLHKVSETEAAEDDFVRALQKANTWSAPYSPSDVGSWALNPTNAIGQDHTGELSMWSYTSMHSEMYNTIGRASGTHLRPSEEEQSLQLLRSRTLADNWRFFGDAAFPT